MRSSASATASSVVISSSRSATRMDRTDACPGSSASAWTYSAPVPATRAGTEAPYGGRLVKAYSAMSILASRNAAMDVKTTAQTATVASGR